VEKDYIKRLNGIYRAVVVDNKDPNNLRRLKVQAQPTGLQVSEWVWPVVSTSKPPSIGSGCWVIYVGGDPEYPVWLGEFGAGTDAPQGGIFTYGSFYSTQTQQATINTATPVTYNVQDVSVGVTVENNSQIHVDYAATYNLQFSLQLHNTGGGGNGTTVQVWLSKNGTAVPYSNTRVDVNTNNPYQVAAWNFMVQLTKFDYVELMWSTNNNNIVIEATASAPPAPEIPSAILTMTQVS
jgi:hypothetical protein